MNILITGVQNPVEESIIKIAVERIEAKAKIRLLSFSDFMDDAESLRDELKLLKNTQKKIRDNVQMKVIKGSGHFILNGYFTVKTKLGYFPVITGAVMEVLKPDIIVHIAVDPLALEGKIDNQESFRMHQSAERVVALSMAAASGAGVKIISCGIDESRKASDELYDLLKNLVVKK
ncbi:MAG: AAA family ATPase [Candidatus Aenigmarchaeota archaeon]|nr:AAA family ATPase [Deltaproteobacteria bacterium]MCD6496195.1 AAA family ATPase [Candidatus Aenigmarchaeota archaeon]